MVVEDQGICPKCPKQFRFTVVFFGCNLPRMVYDTGCLVFSRYLYNGLFSSPHNWVVYTVYCLDFASSCVSSENNLNKHVSLNPLVDCKDLEVHSRFFVNKNMREI